MFQHNAHRVFQQSTFSSVGENLAATSGTVDYKALVLDWYKENVNYNYDSNSCNGACGHYTQVYIYTIIVGVFTWSTTSLL